jgi:hypothetical protein
VSRPDRERRIALVLEVVLKAALFVLLGAATAKFFAMLHAVGVAWWKGLPVAIAFLAAAVWSGRGALARLRELRRDADRDVGR